MTTMPETGRVPEFTLGWRLRLSIESAGTSVQQMADDLGYSRSSISRWLNDLDEPRVGIIAQWCLLTRVDRQWLETGVTAGPTPPTTPSGDPDALRRLTDSKRGRTRTTRPHPSTHGYVSAAW